MKAVHALKRVAQANVGIAFGMAVFTASQYPEAMTGPQPMLNAVVRNSRQTWVGTVMATDYYCNKVWDSKLHERNAKRLYDMFLANSGIFIKVGQHIGQMDTWVAEEYLKVFEPFYQQMPTSSYESIKKIFELETGKKLEDVFSEFDKKPLASASLA